MRQYYPPRFTDKDFTVNQIVPAYNQILSVMCKHEGQLVKINWSDNRDPKRYAAGDYETKFCMRCGHPVETLRVVRVRKTFEGGKANPR